MDIGKKPLESKKFMAYLLAEITWTGLLVLCITKAVDGFWMPILIAMVVTKGFLEVSLVLGQSYIDRYLYVASLALGGKEEDRPTSDE